MNRMGLLVSFILASVLTGCGQKTLVYLDSGDVDWGELRGSTVFINYWAEWCKPCREEIPELNALQKTYPERVVVLGVNFDRPDTAGLRRQAESLGIEFELLQQDPFEVLGYERPKMLPATLVFDPAGDPITTLVGPQTLASLTEQVPKLID